MIKHVKGDLIEMAKDGKFDVIMYGCNCFCNMGAGIAKTIREEFPEAYEADCKTKKGDSTKLGDFSQAKIKTENGKDLKIVNLYTQYKWGPNAEYSAIRDSLQLWVGETIAPDEMRIGIPWIGAGLGGLDINIVKKIINNEAEWSNLNITMVEFNG